ncbi:MAG: HDOD domain-containing protein [Desulfurivibrionaceae bacterium]
MSDALVEIVLDHEEASTARQLLRDISKIRDFPALSQVISEVNRISRMENSSTDELTEAILKDVALTNKLLRLVNSAVFSQFTEGRQINTVSRAIVILGYDIVRDTAMALMLFEHLNNHAQAAELKGEAAESFFCGIIGRALANKAGMGNGEEVFICSLLCNLGRMMCRLHFYERSKMVDRLIVEEGLSEAVAARRVFGMSYDKFGLAIGQMWHMPTELLQGMTPLPANVPIKTPANDQQRMRIFASMAFEICSGMREAPPEAMKDVIKAVSKKYDQAVHIPAKGLINLLNEAGQTMEREAHILEIDVRSSQLLRRLLTDVDKAKSGEAEEAGEVYFGEIGAASSDNDPTSLLIAGMQDLTSMMLGDFNPVELLQVASELLYRSGHFDHVLISTIATSGKELIGRIGFGPNAERLKKGLHIPLHFSPDVFHAALSKNVDILISDTQADNIRNRIPAWHSEYSGARSFLLLPISMGGQPVALIYCNRQAESLALSPQILNLVKALRNQVALALRQRAL